jgi:hypothetical protein
VASLAEPRAKLRRSRQHLDDLIDDYCRVFGLERDGDWATPTRDVTADTTQRLVTEDDGHWVVFSQRMPELPAEDWGLILGDAVHNARSALDLLVCQLLALNGRTPTRWNGFPIYSTPPKDARERKRLAGYLAGLRPEHADGIRALQPFALAGGSREAWKLRTLGSLDNLDKHQLVHPVFSYETRGEEWLRSRIHVTPPGPVRLRVAPVAESISGGELELVRVQAPLSTHVRIDWAVGTSVGFGLADVTLLDLVEIHAYVVGIVESFAPDF